MPEVLILDRKVVRDYDNMMQINVNWFAANEGIEELLNYGAELTITTTIKDAADAHEPTAYAVLLGQLQRIFPNQYVGA